MQREEVALQIGMRVLEILELAASIEPQKKPVESLTDIRKSLGLSKTDLAARVGCDVSYLSALEHGRVSNPGIRNRGVLMRMCSQLSSGGRTITLPDLLKAIAAQKRAS